MSRALTTDLLIGLGIGVLVAVGPFTPGAWGPSIAAGVLFGCGYVGWRLYGRRRVAQSTPVDTSTAPEPDAGTREEGLSRTSPSVWLALVLLAVVFAPTGLWLYHSWTSSIWSNAHGILIPPVMGWMIYTALRNDPQPGPEHSAWGFLFVIPGLFLVSVDSVLRTYQLAAIGLVLTLPGLSLLLLGLRRTREIAIPLMLGIFMIPIRNTVTIHLYLKSITAWAVEPLLSFIGIPVMRENTVLVLPNATFLVADACSGFSTLYAAVGISVVLAAYARSWPRRILLIAAAWPLAVLCNIVRVTILVGIANEYGLGLLDTPFHAASGVATFWAILLVLIFLSDREGLRGAAT